MSTVHTSAASLYRAILDAASTSWEDSEAVTLEAVRPGDPDEDASNYCTAEFRGPWLDVKRAMLLEVPMHGPVRPYPAPMTFKFQATGARASFKVQGSRDRLLAQAEVVRKNWSLFGGGPLPAELVKPKAARRVSEYKPGELRLWADMIAEKQYADALDYGDKLGAIYYPGTKERPIVLAGPQPVAGMPDGIVSGMRGHDREYVVFHLASGRSIGDGARTRKGAESNALQAVADAMEKKGADFLEKAIAAAPVVDTAAAREEWRKAHGLIDLPESALDAAPGESAEEWAARMVAQVSEPAEHAEAAQPPVPVAQLQLTAWQAAAARADVPAPENESEAAALAEACLARFGVQDCASCEHLAAFPAWLSETLSLMRGAADKRARAIVYGVHCQTAAIARKIAPDALADGVRLRRSVNEPGFDAASMALRRSVAQAMRAARGPADTGEVARIAALWADKPGASAELRARAENMRAGVIQGRQWPGAVQDAAADLTMARVKVYHAAADAIDAARPGPVAPGGHPAADAAPMAVFWPPDGAAPPVAHAAPPVVQVADADFLRRVKMAAAWIGSGRKTSRAFDSCFEMWDGDAVCAALLRRVQRQPDTKLAANIWRYLCRSSVEDAAARMPADMTLAQWSAALIAERAPQDGPPAPAAAPVAPPAAVAPPVEVCAPPVGELPVHPLVASAAKLAEIRARMADESRPPAVSDGFLTYILTGRESSHAKLAAAFAVFDSVGIGAELANTDGRRFCVILPDASAPGAYRWQGFDKSGFFTHSTHKTAALAVADAADQGYTVAAPGSLDRLASAPEWARGMAISEVMQAHNAGLMPWAAACDRMRDIHAEHDALAAAAAAAPAGPDLAPAPRVAEPAPPVTVSAGPDAATMRSAADRAQVLADGIKAAAGDDPATMARMLKSEAARVKAAAHGMPARIAASYRATADMLEYAAELQADALAKAPIPARQAQPSMMVQATARRPGMARCGPLAQHWRTGPSMARRPWCQARRGPAAPRMLPPAAAPPVTASASPVAKFLGIN